MATTHETHHPTKPLFLRALGTTNAVELGKLYFIFALINAAIAGLYALLIRTELWTPEGDLFKDADGILSAEAYNNAFTIHGTGMIFLVIVPLGAGFGNFLIPRLVAADNNDMYWPKWNSVALWMLPIGSSFIWFSQASAGWTAYPPLSIIAPGVDMWVTGLVFAGTSSTIGAINFILTIWKGRAPYVEWMKMDLFVWGTLLTSLLVIFATPVLTIALVMVLLDRNFNTAFFDPNISNPLYYQHIFWFYSHPAVYIMVLPAFGIISTIIARFARKKEVFGYASMVIAMAAIAVLSFSVWVHHMFTTGLDPFVRIYFTSMTFIIAIPSGIKVFNWLTTLYGGKIKFEAPMKFSLAFIIQFTLGGITGVYVNIVALDVNLHDSYWVVGHFHFIVAGGTFVAMFAAFYYYFADITGGKMYNKLLADLHFWFWVIGSTVAFTAFQMLGMEGMPRRYWVYPAKFQMWHQVATIGAFLMGISFLFFLSSMFLGYFKGEDANMDDPFDLGRGYDYPKPFAEYIKETTGEDLHVVHNLSLWAPLGTFSLVLPFLAIASFIKEGPFQRDGMLEFLVDERARGEAFVEFVPYMFLGIFLIIGGIMFFSIAKEPIEQDRVVDKYRAGNRHWEMWVFLASEVIFFAALIGTGYNLRINAAPGQWPEASEVLNVNFTAVLTFILIAASYFMASSVDSAKIGDMDKMKRNLLITTILIATFLVGQVIEFRELYNHGEVALVEGATYPLFSSAFYIQTGFHGLHVLFGLFFLIFALMRAYRGGYSKENHEYIELVGLYIHFVDIVWILLFPIVYLF